MYYVVRKDEALDQYHAKFLLQKKARKYAISLKETFGHNYDVIRVEKTWTTQTLDEAIQEPA